MNYWSTPIVFCLLHTQRPLHQVQLWVSSPPEMLVLPFNHVAMDVGWVKHSTIGNDWVWFGPNSLLKIPTVGQIYQNFMQISLAYMSFELKYSECLKKSCFKIQLLWSNCAHPQPLGFCLTHSIPIPRCLHGQSAFLFLRRVMGMSFGLKYADAAGCFFFFMYSCMLLLWANCAHPLLMGFCLTHFVPIKRWLHGQSAFTIQLLIKLRRLSAYGHIIGVIMLSYPFEPFFSFKKEYPMAAWFIEALWAHIIYTYAKYAVTELVLANPILQAKYHFAGTNGQMTIGEPTHEQTH